MTGDGGEGLNEPVGAESTAKDVGEASTGATLEKEKSSERELTEESVPGKGGGAEAVTRDVLSSKEVGPKWMLISRWTSELDGPRSTV